MKKIRESNFELLRILSMFLIVMNHFIGVWPNWHFSNQHFGNEIVVQIFSSGGKIGVNLFVLITGYFLFSKKININSGVTVWLKNITYSWLTLVIILFLRPVGLIELTRRIFPTVTSFMWFSTAYLVLFLLVPIINKIIHVLSKTMRIYLLAVLFVALSILPTVGVDFAYSNVSWLIFVYLTGAEIALSGNQRKKISNIWLIIVGIILFSIGILSILCFRYFHFLPGRENYLMWFGNSTISYLISIVIFLFFKNLRFKNVTINKLASYMFDVYLIQALIWEIFIHFNKIQTFESGMLFWIYIIVGPIIIFLICILAVLLIDFVTQKPMKKIGLFVGNQLQSLINRFITK